MTGRMHVDLDDLDDLVRTLNALAGELPALTTELRTTLAAAGVAFGVDPVADVIRPRFGESARLALDALGAVDTLMREHIAALDAAGTRLRTADSSAAPVFGARGDKGLVL
ncbi:hypothetical protein GII30_09595 [Gordonia amarae]|nr:hypothetical protein [Gordonia amarae]MCS3878634.1 hypothetical protein [Gordonia amarae]QHN17228.1 hypothetical protein GII35_09820 [Gordonia amarae]QHN21754.1 hypothetical protein GII34_09600 [Gordonia amarae]QHN30605.1 hypothetical protein GII32_09610 [Gordonia amarae]QHN39382.1 hypothetical protein GII30_09595 [Gordonia amarae]